MGKQDKLQQEIYTKPCLVRDIADGGMESVPLSPKFKYRISLADDLSEWLTVGGQELFDMVTNKGVNVLNMIKYPNGTVAFSKPFELKGKLDNNGSVGGLNALMARTGVGYKGRVAFGSIDFMFEYAGAPIGTRGNQAEIYDGEFLINERKIADFQVNADVQADGVYLHENKYSKGDYMVVISIPPIYSCTMYVKDGAKSYIIVDDKGKHRHLFK